MSSELAVEVRGLRFRYPDGQDALRGVDLAVRHGEKVAIIGPNGAGKSTLLMHLNGLLHGEGAIRIMGQRLEEGDRDGLRRIRALVGVVFQDPDDQLFSSSVYEDVAFGPVYMGLPPEEVDARVREALAHVGLADYGGRMPHHLSGGEKKRAAVATVLSMRPPVLVMDEPSSGLDPRARRGLIDLMARFDQSLIVGTHDIFMVREIFDRTVVLDDGRVVAHGPTEAILSDADLLEKHGLRYP